MTSIFCRDGDGIPNEYDNCDKIPNGEQTDTDKRWSWYVVKYFISLSDKATIDE